MKLLSQTLIIAILCTLCTTATSADEETEPSLAVINDTAGEVEGTQYHAASGIFTQDFLGFEGNAVYLRDSRRGPNTEDLKIMTDAGVIAVVVVTKIREGLPQDDSILDRITPSYEQLKGQLGEAVQIDDAIEDNHRRFRVSITDEGYERDVFPYGMTLRREGEPESIGIHHFVSRQGFLLEFVVLVRGDEGRDVLEEKALRHIDLMLASNSFTSESAVEIDGENAADDSE